MSTLVVIALILFYALFAFALIISVKRFVDYVKRNEK
jgi:hypothetical protein